jgi:predicted ATP-grasp superfamily ATP-dependent carboligase
VDTNVDLSAAFRQLGANTNFVGQIRQQMLAGNPEAARKYDELVSGLLSGQLNVSDVRQQAQTAAAQLRELKRQLGPEADDSLDGYLQVLDSFIKETANEPADAAPKSP